MKRIIDGVTYNTDTSERLAVSQCTASYANEPYDCRATLYRTRGGAFFVHERIDLGVNDDGLREHADRAKAMSAAEAEQWIMTGDVEVFHNPFGEPPEAVTEVEPSATIYIRVPAGLKQRAEQAAKDAELSLNAWSIRSFERSLALDNDVAADDGHKARQSRATAAPERLKLPDIKPVLDGMK